MSLVKKTNKQNVSFLSCWLTGMSGDSVMLVAAKAPAEPKGGKKAAAPSKGGKGGAKAASVKEEKTGLFGSMSPLEVFGAQFVAHHNTARCSAARKLYLFGPVERGTESERAWVGAGNMAAGATAGAAVETALYPIDTIKTRLQACYHFSQYYASRHANGDLNAFMLSFMEFPSPRAAGSVPAILTAPSRRPACRRRAQGSPSSGRASTKAWLGTSLCAPLITAMQPVRREVRYSTRGFLVRLN